MNNKNNIGFLLTIGELSRQFIINLNSASKDMLKMLRKCNLHKKNLQKMREKKKICELSYFKMHINYHNQQHAKLSQHSFNMKTLHMRMKKKNHTLQNFHWKKKKYKLILVLPF